MRPVILLALLSLIAVPVLGQDQEPDKKVKHRADVITLEEIDAVRSEFSDAYDLVRRLRPQFLRSRGARSFGKAASGKRTA